ncbi:unnamed protein product [Lactuca virosa]|uniref:HAT C-terminal dimerisation domain-containing protein n=1 Tax=Lactuca virosa TaxID=75947 RepID=A0AAU9PVP9_9ASTR|nr:unnamed protein product [Lactuca virosa]
MVDGETKPAMGYIDEVMDRAKEAIAKSFCNKKEEYKKAFEIIDQRRECQLHRPLHAAGHYLNPETFYDNQESASCEEVMKGLYACIEQLVPDSSIQDKISAELSVYQNVEGLFGIPMAIRQRKTKPPAEWWISYGSSTPNLKNFVVRVLSLTCSATSCERNSGVFQHIVDTKKGYGYPILLHEINESNEWLMGRMEEDKEDDFVFEGEDLTWDVVEEASGVNEPYYSTRASRDSRGKETMGSSRAPPRDVLVDENEMEEDIGLSSDEYGDMVLEVDGYDDDE